MNDKQSDPREQPTGADGATSHGRPPRPATPPPPVSPPPPAGPPAAAPAADSGGPAAPGVPPAIVPDTVPPRPAGRPRPAAAGCSDVRTEVGAYVLGALDDDRTRVVREHLVTCASCREAYDELAGLPAFLARLTPAEAEATGPAAAEPPARVLADAARRAHRGRRTRHLLLGAAAALVAAAGLGGWLLGSSDDSTGPEVSAAAPPSATVPAPPPGSPAPAGLRTATGATGPVQATVRFAPSEWGTSVDLSMTGVRPGTRCQLDIYGTRGRQETASSWLVPQQPYGPEVTVPGGTSISPDEILRFEVTVVGGDGDPVVRIEPPRSAP